MKLFLKIVFCCALIFSIREAWSQNQTNTLSPVLPQDLPFNIEITQASFSMPTGIQSYASANYNGFWIFLAGRTNGLHGFSNVGNNFPPSAQNTVVYVIDPATGTSWSRDMTTSDLAQANIDALSVTASESFQKGNTLYFVGGYGINTALNQMETKSLLTAINLKTLFNWVLFGNVSLSSALRQVSHPYLQVTGGYLFQANDHQPWLLMLGQNFTGDYTPGSNGQYTQQIRPFWLNDDGQTLSIIPLNSSVTYPDYRRRDLNIAPILQNDKFAYVALGGVFTLAGGVWTVPITIYPDGSSYEPNPNDPDTFMQAMNQYYCPSFGLYSTGSKEMYVVLPGGISYGYFSNGQFETDDEDPFINQVTTVKIDKYNTFTQYLMNNEYPVIASTGTNPGNPLLFGAEAVFLPSSNMPLFTNGVIQLDALPSGVPIVIGYIVGGIMSTLPNTNTQADSTASPYVFAVTLTKS
jgi:hypothetical protein